ncbi:hypothetical protein [Parapedobacter koreensis]|uniref:hypothetical protein n=1 Tax=Parapedobacter koreensis TaxID=332977 RepID=UPI0015A651BF|nr:hypothetical protein [Parapedobacter koreensis]
MMRKGKFGGSEVGFRFTAPRLDPWRFADVSKVVSAANVKAMEGKGKLGNE